ncbi:MAG: MDR family MFS transporter [Pseudonocardia sp.]
MELVSAPPSATADPEEATTPTGAWLVPLLVLVSGMFMVVLDISIVNVAIPTIQNDFGAAVDDIEWISTAYNLTLAATVPMAGWLGDRLGLTRVWLVCLAGFAMGSALCGLAWDLDSLIAFRIVQAVPGGVLPVITMALLYRIVPRAKLGIAMGVFGLGILVGPAIGPTLGGYLVEYVDWRLIFLINVPVAVGGVVAGLLLLPRLPPTSTRPFDWWGFITAGSGLFALLLAVSEGDNWGWDSYPIMILAVFAALSLSLFVVIELGRDDPLIDLRVLRNRLYVNSLLIMMVLVVGLFSVLFYLPLYMQGSLGYQPLHTGLILMPEAIVLTILMPIAGTLYDRIGPFWPAVIGLTIATAGGFMLTGVGPDMTEGDIILWTCVRAAGNGLAMMPIITAGLASIPPALTTSASLMNNVVQQLSSALGLAGMTVLATNQHSQLSADRAALIPATPAELAAHGIDPSDPVGLYGIYRELEVQVLGQAYSDVFFIAALLTAAGLVLAFFIRKPPTQPGPPAPPTGRAATNNGYQRPVAGEMVERTSDTESHGNPPSSACRRINSGSSAS